MTVTEETPTVRKRGRRNPRRQATSTELQTTQKRADAIRLRIGGSSYDQIADQLGYANRSAAFKAVEAGRLAILAEPAGELITYETERLDAMQATAWQVLDKAKASGDHELALKAIDRVVRICESPRRLLGLDAPTRTDIIGDGGGIQVIFDSALAPRQCQEPVGVSPSSPGAPVGPVKGRVTV